VFLVSSNRGIGLHTAERVEALFPGHFRNYIFVSVGTVDSESYGSEQSLTTLQYETRATLDALVSYAHCQGRAARWNDAYGSDRLVELEKLEWSRPPGAARMRFGYGSGCSVRELPSKSAALGT